VKNKVKNSKRRPDVVAHACNPSYAAGGNWEDNGLMPAQEKSHSCNPSYVDDIGKRIMV
jgi:hypothetical protein